jgi:hypothetical protein
VRYKIPGVPGFLNHSPQPSGEIRSYDLFSAGVKASENLLRLFYDFLLQVHPFKEHLTRSFKVSEGKPKLLSAGSFDYGGASRELPPGLT